MMRITKIIALAAAFAALSACTKEQEPNVISFEKGQKVTLNVSASIPEVSATKVTSSINAYNSKQVDFKWSTGDKIKVSVGSSSAEFTLVSGSNDVTATFQGLMPPPVPPSTCSTLSMIQTSRPRPTQTTKFCLTTR